MGLARAAIHLLLNEAARQPFSGSVLTLGRQHVYATAEEVRSMAERLACPLRNCPEQLHRETALAEKGYVSDDWLLQSLGFDQIVRLDFSDYEQPDFILDLNQPETPNNLTGRFDLVLDSGTLEHIFDIAAGLRHCARMVRQGGRVVHLTPTSNCVEHGFYSVSPTLFADFYTASGFDVQRIWLCEIPLDLMRGTWDVYDYLGSSQRFISNGQLNDQIWFTFAVASSRQLDLTRTPQQWYYQQTWSHASAAQQLSTSSAAKGGDTAINQFEPGSKAARLVQSLSAVPWAQRYMSGIIHRWRSWRHQRSLSQHRLPYQRIGRF